MKDQQSKISALVITYNEIIHIEELIENLSFADEIIVIDSFSNDGTFEKLKTYSHVKTIQRKFVNFADQKNYALSLAMHDWVLFLDADERISDTFIEEATQKTALKNNLVVAYFGKFRFYYGKKPIRFSGFQTAKSYRLFRKSKCHYNSSKIVHENLIVDGESGTLKHHIKHYSFRNYEHFKQKTEHYATLKAQDLLKKGQTLNWYHFYIKPAYNFITNFIFRLGFLDGKEGYILCKLNAYGVKYRYTELQRLLMSSPKF